GKVADGDLDIEFVDQRRVAGRAYETAHLIALLHQPLRQVPADEPSRARDEANVVTRRIDALAAKWRLIDHRNVMRGSPTERRGGDIAHDGPVLTRGAVTIGEHSVERAEEATRLGLGECQRRQQLDHVGLTGR